ncbi:unnamed protein product [Tenebrio molitor]|nr:unnamed protein product [Tenebrio molitor]
MSAKNAVVPVIPKCCDCNSYSNKQKTIFFGFGRATVSLISLTLCIAFLANLSRFIESEQLLDSQRAKTIRSILIVICVVNIIHIFISIFIILITRSNIGKPRSIKFWLISDLAICTVYVLCVLIILFTLPLWKLFLIIGTSLIILSIFLAYRSSVAYVIYKSDEARSF